jgi:hypothetical protein
MDFDDEIIRSDAAQLTSNPNHGRKRRQASQRVVFGDEAEPMFSVRGAGASVLAVQDAGTYQMLHDECGYLCSTMVASKSPSVAIEAAIDLAMLLSSRKTRAVVWQGDAIATASISESAQAARSEESDRKRRKHNNTVIQSILDVLSVATQTPSEATIGNTTSSSNMRSRTKSARKKSKDQQLSASVSAAATMTPQMRKVLSCILYFLSWDCTVSEQNSIATIGSVKTPSVARKMRRSILKHPTALQGIMRLVMADSAVQNSTLDEAGSIASASFSSNHRSAGARPQSSQDSISISNSAVPTKEVSFSATAPSSPTNSFSFSEERAALNPTAIRSRDPAAAGRRKRRTKRKQLEFLHAIPEDELDWPGTSIVPPVKNAASMNTPTMSFASDDTGSKPPASPPRSRRGPAGERSTGMSPDRSSMSTCSSNHSLTTAKVGQKLQKLISRIVLLCPSSESDPTDSGPGSDEADSKEGSWAASVALESLNRIITGKEDETGSSCLEGVERDTDDNTEENGIDDERHNPILLTNLLLGKSGFIPLLARAMSQSLVAFLSLLDEDISNEDYSRSLSHLHYRISMLAALIDGACLLDDNNRRALCEEDPFSFDKNTEGLVFHLLLVVRRLRAASFANLVVDESDEQLSDVMLSALRQLTSLTHENELAADQVVMRNEFGCDEDGNSFFRGLDILAHLLYQLDGEGASIARKATASAAGEEDKRRFDCSIFCLNSLANIVESGDVRRMITELHLPESEESWLRWLCRWLVSKTEGFRDALIGTDDGEGKSSTASRNIERVLQKHEDDSLVAAGNCCALLACLLMEPEVMAEEPVPTNTIRKIVLEEMPRNEDGGSSGVSLITNTLKAFCNFYHYSVGDLSVAVVIPVKRLIEGLEKIEEL